MKFILLLAAALAILSALPANAQSNTSAGAAATLAFGHSALTRTGGGATEFWFNVSPVIGRSYCAETAHQDGSSGMTESFVDSILQIYSSDGVTLVATNDDIEEEPLANRFSRVCWVATPTNWQSTFIRVTNKLFFSGTVRFLQLRVVETTLFCPWFFIAGDYNAFSLIRNTSGTPLSGVVVTWRGLDGSVAGTTTVSIPPNGGVIVNARDFVNPALFSNGTIEIAYPGALDQLQGSTTTLSGTTGLGFDASFTHRSTW